MATPRTPPTGLDHFHPAVAHWFAEAFPAPTDAQTGAWPAIAEGRNTLLLAPTGSGKTLAAFLIAIDRIMFPRQPRTDLRPGVRILYISPLKALGVDVQRNLRSPIAGVRAVANREGVPHHEPTVGIRSGDTPSADRQRMVREPPDILITTPESLYLMLTSRARDTLRTVNTVIVDEIHSMVGTKRGSHLFLSLERLEWLRRQADPEAAPMQRIGLSATQRPLEEVARLLGGGEATADAEVPVRPRPVEIIEAGRRKTLELTVEMPEEPDTDPEFTSGPAAGPQKAPSIWPSIHPRLVELVRAHTSTMIFVNSRRLAERLASAINELAGEELAAAHHGSIAKDTRLLIEDRLKRGQLPAIVATSSMELGIDMGAVDLVIQVAAPPSIASGIQRIGRAGHQVGVPSRGVIIPKYRGDLLACSAVIERMLQGEVEETFYPRNPLDVLAQQLVAMVALEGMKVDDAYALARSAAPFFDLPRSAFEGVLDLLSGRYPSDEFAGLRPRLTWDRLDGTISPRSGTQRVAIANGGTIPDRGLYGVFLADGSGGGSRVGELDEEMVFETHVGDVFRLGASSWRVLDITHDRVMVAPAPGEPARMPFWKGDGPGRPLEFGRAIGQLTRELTRMDPVEARERLTERHALDGRAADLLLEYLREQVEATEEAPSDRTIVIESFLDEVGDWRVTVMTPFGARVHAPWATAVTARLRNETAGEVDMMYTDDGMVFRLPESDAPPPAEAFLPRSDEVEDIVVRELGSTALFAAHFRENAARALLLPRRQPGRRTPLWIQRRRSADLLSVAAQYERFPILLETYRECLRDVFDITGLKKILADVERRAIRIRVAQTPAPSPFAASLLFNYTANFLYEGDAPLAERRAATLALDHAQLRELLGDAELRELLDADVVDQLALDLQRLAGDWPVRDPDGVHDLLLQLGDLTRDEIAARLGPDAGERLPHLDDWLRELTARRRIVPVGIAGETRYIAAEEAARYRDALGVVIPHGLPDAFLEPVADALADVVSRYARTHVPFHVTDAATRFGLGPAPVQAALHRLAARDRVLEGEFLPGGRGREWVDADVLRQLKRRSLARLRREVEPVDPERLGRFLVQWQGVDRPRRGLDGLLDVVEQIQGTPLPAADLERSILPARLEQYQPNDLDELCAAGEIVWQGIESLGSFDGRIALYLTDHAARLAPVPAPVEEELAARVRDLLQERGALFFDEIAGAVGGFRNDALDALWQLVWSGHVTNDTLAPVRALRRQRRGRAAARRERGRRAFRSRRSGILAGSEGRWSLFARGHQHHTPTARQAAIAAQLLERYGVVTREMVGAEGIAGGFSGLYPVFKAMEESGKIRRGYFVAGQGAAQFAAPGALDRLRERESEAPAQAIVLAATDPANPWGASLRWPERDDLPARPQRAGGARVIVQEGRLLGWLSRSGRNLIAFPREGQDILPALVEALVRIATSRRPVLIASVDGVPVDESTLAPLLREAGFIPSRHGYIRRVTTAETRDAAHQDA